MKTLTPSTRLNESPVPIIGLTGGIATGKSTVAKMLKKSGIAVIDADKLVKDIYEKPETLEFIKGLCPEVIDPSGIQFPKLREVFFQDQEIKNKVEAFIYQRLPAQFKNELHKNTNAKSVVYDVPLLFEKGLDQSIDLTVVVYAPRKVQLARLKTRDGTLEELAKKILDQQMDIEEKKTRADIVIDNSQTEQELAEEVNRLLRQFETYGLR